VASNLVAGDTNATTDVFVHDRQSGGVARASVSGTGAQVIGTLDGPAIAPDGSRVAFHSGATTLVEGDTNGAADVFIRKL
jgi:Tol biopolymer transport system component